MIDGIPLGGGDGHGGSGDEGVMDVQIARPVQPDRAHRTAGELFPRHYGLPYTLPILEQSNRVGGELIPLALSWSPCVSSASLHYHPRRYPYIAPRVGRVCAGAWPPPPPRDRVDGRGSEIGPRLAPSTARPYGGAVRGPVGYCDRCRRRRPGGKVLSEPLPPGPSLDGTREVEGGRSLKGGVGFGPGHATARGPPVRVANRAVSTRSTPPYTPLFRPPPPTYSPPDTRTQGCAWRRW